MKVSNLPDKEYKDRVIKMLIEQDEMVGWHHQRDGREFEQAPGLVINGSLVVHGVAKSQT